MRTPDATAARTAARQHSVITFQQLLAAGVSRAGIHRRLRAGRLYRVHPGVYAVGHPGLTREGRYLAAVLACGDRAVLSHGAAAHVLSLIKGPAPAPEVTAPNRRRVDGITVHRTRTLHPLETSVLDAIPITTVPRTLVDLAADLSLGDLARACHEAHVHHRATPPMIEAVIARAPNRAGMGRLKQALLGDHLLLSRLEAEFLRILARAGLPLPRTNVVRAEGRVDCHWPAKDLTVELDSPRFHATRHQWEADVRRARRAGGTHLRFTWGDVHERPGQTLAELRPHLVQPAT